MRRTFLLIAISILLNIKESGAFNSYCCFPATRGLSFSVQPRLITSQTPFYAWGIGLQSSRTLGSFVIGPSVSVGGNHNIPQDYQGYARYFFWTVGYEAEFLPFKSWSTPWFDFTPSIGVGLHYLDSRFSEHDFWPAINGASFVGSMRARLYMIFSQTYIFAGASFEYVLAERARFANGDPADVNTLPQSLNRLPEVGALIFF